MKDIAGTTVVSIDTPEKQQKTEAATLTKNEAEGMDDITHLTGMESGDHGLDLILPIEHGLSMLELMHQDDYGDRHHQSGVV